MADKPTSWIVARVRPNQLSRAVFNVEKQGCEAYVPMLAVRKRRQWSAEPLFPGYLFVRPANPAWMFLRSTVGILDVLMVGDERPAWLPDLEIQQLKAREDNGVIKPRSLGFTMGDKVRVNKGAVSLDAIVDGMAAHDRVFVLLQVLGRWTRAEVALDDLQKDY